MQKPFDTCKWLFFEGRISQNLFDFLFVFYRKKKCKISLIIFKKIVSSFNAGNNVVNVCVILLYCSV